ncbi:RING-variant protein [Operophtera brumata]|uniref:RING-variant protein n=1 Tax=Operophtera brumata TaxID=104452 RepID=A0A0L7LH90_OPEBR|nr:RING-variant protein [Operophtera brumata]
MFVGSDVCGSNILRLVSRSLIALPTLMPCMNEIKIRFFKVFHLRDIRWERPRFLSKSFLAFVTFNLISFSLLAAEVLTTNSFYQHVFNGCYAVMLLIVYSDIFKETKVCTILSPRAGPSTADDDDVSDTLVTKQVCTILSPRAGPSTADDDDVSDTLVTKQGVLTDLSDGSGNIDISQLHQSRVGLVSQALMLIIIAGFLASETLSELWKTKVPVVSRNWHDLVFRLAEIGVALWFPCVLWNSMAPERLWLLNPRRLLARQLDDSKLADLLAHRRLTKASNLATAMYSSGWHNCRGCSSERVRKLLVIAMSRAQVTQIFDFKKSR